MPHSANGYLRETITFSDNSLGLLQSACIKAIIPISTGRLKLVFADNKDEEVKALLKSKKGVKIPTLQVKLFEHVNVPVNTITYTNVELVLVSAEVLNSPDKVVTYNVEVVAESMTSTNEW